MKEKIFALVITVIFGVCLLTPGFCDMSAEEILKKVAELSFKENFRLALTIKTFRGQKNESTRSIWVSGRLKQDKADFFFDFDEPQESKGLRFLLQIQPNQLPKVFMYLPATGKTLSVITDDPSADIGGTGLNVDDILGFAPKPGEKYSIANDDKTGGQEYWIIRISRPNEGGERLAWVRKKDFVIVKSQDLDINKKIIRTYRVTEFFKTDDGREMPREEEITITMKNTRIVVRQEHAVFGIDLPDQLFDPEQFGTYKWKN
ncbi:MAG: outer membrane lipoprotein-sorting protein [Pseudomonadota bacterium]